MLHSKIFFKTHTHACPHMHVYMSFSKVSYRMSHKNITQYHCSNACLGIIIVLLYPITYFQMAPCSAVHQREIGWLGQTKQTRGWQHFMGAPGWASGTELRHEAFQTCNLDWGDEQRKAGKTEQRENRKQGWGLGEKRKGNTENLERNPCSQSWRWDLRMAKSGSIRLVHMD